MSPLKTLLVSSNLDEVSWAQDTFAQFPQLLRCHFYSMIVRMRLSFVTDKKEQRAKISKPVIIQSYFGYAITFPKFQSLHVYSIAFI